MSSGLENPLGKKLVPRNFFQLILPMVILFGMPDNSLSQVSQESNQTQVEPSMEYNYFLKQRERILEIRRKFFNYFDDMDGGLTKDSVHKLLRLALETYLNVGAFEKEISQNQNENIRALSIFEPNSISLDLIEEIRAYLSSEKRSEDEVEAHLRTYLQSGTDLAEDMSPGNVSIHLNNSITKGLICGYFGYLCPDS